MPMEIEVVKVCKVRMFWNGIKVKDTVGTAFFKGSWYLSSARPGVHFRLENYFGGSELAEALKPLGVERLRNDSDSREDYYVKDRFLFAPGTICSAPAEAAMQLQVEHYEALTMKRHATAKRRIENLAHLRRKRTGGAQ